MKLEIDNGMIKLVFMEPTFNQMQESVTRMKMSSLQTLARRQTAPKTAPRKLQDKGLHSIRALMIPHNIGRIGFSRNRQKFVCGSFFTTVALDFIAAES